MIWTNLNQMYFCDRDDDDDANEIEIVCVHALCVLCCMWFGVPRRRGFWHSTLKVWTLTHSHSLLLCISVIIVIVITCLYLVCFLLNSSSAIHSLSQKSKLMNTADVLYVLSCSFVCLLYCFTYSHCSLKSQFFSEFNTTKVIAFWFLAAYLALTIFWRWPKASQWMLGQIGRLGCYQDSTTHQYLSMTWPRTKSERRHLSYYSNQEYITNNYAFPLFAFNIYRWHFRIWHKFLQFVDGCSL